MIELTPQRRRELRAQAHILHPVVSVGQHGITPQVLHEIDIALGAHGLIKVRVFSDDRAQRETMLAQIANDLEAAPVQHVGKVLILWRTPEEAPKEKPRAKAKPRKERGAKGAKRSSKDSAVREPRAGPATRRRTTDATYNDRTRARTSARDGPATAKKRAPRSAEEAPPAPDARRRRRTTGVPATSGGKRPRDAAFGARDEQKTAPGARGGRTSSTARDRSPTGKSAPNARRRRTTG